MFFFSKYGIGIGIVNYWRCLSSTHSLLRCCLRIVKCCSSIIFFSNFFLFDTYHESYKRRSVRCFRIANWYGKVCYH